ncbi:Peptidase, M16 family [Candidatus Cyrtobacter comes]|uniref:Peptidase, M16 family n=1 Tax=Candidatus Cyrtobacter comes TaxID=675776 RepID=A0ABU5L7C2_9RICK|nr:pitrilysin family protein [Candidatus Cyrtobacter comes]MDZ5761709.1 Peptidase, M16 family [Candidatus Cyrtobacter comes]
MENISKTRRGLVVLSDEMRDVDSISLEVYVEVGSRHENEKTSGISHIIEHMAFKGTKTRTWEMISNEFSLMGGYFNAYTSKETTVYFLKVLKEHLTRAVDILSDIIQYSTFPKTELEKERGPILEEYLKTEDEPSQKLFDIYHQQAFSNQPLGMPIIGTKELILNVSRDDLVSYVNNRYGCNTMFISAAGNVSHQELHKLVEEKFDVLQEKANKDFISGSYTGGDVRLEKDLQQIHVAIGLPGASSSSDYYYIQKILTTVLGGGMSSRLFKEVREKRGLAYHISSFGYNHMDTGLFSTYFASSPSNANEVIKIISEQLLSMTENIDEQELEIAKAQLKSGLLMSRESTSSRAERLSRLYSLFQTIIPIENSVAKINSVTIEDLKNMMKNILKDNLVTFAAIGKTSELFDYKKIKNYLVF